MSDGTTTWSYTYNADGMRTFRTNNDGGTYRYVYNGGELDYLRVTEKDANGNEIGWVMRFSYTPDGVPLTISYAGSTYYYITNLQGDVVALVDSYGNTVVEYTYDAWGNPLSTFGSMANSLGKRNPLRYRGYVYDRETGLYYLQSRYYGPEVGRFINADGLISTGGLLGNNMFAYCLNNPVNCIDKGGDSSDNFFGWVGEELGKLFYEWLTGDDHPDHQTRVLENKIVSTQTDMIADAGEIVWDAYMRGYNMQQEAQLMEAHAKVEGAASVYSFLAETGAIDMGMNTYHAVQAARSFKNSSAYFFAPIPTPADEALALGYALKGFYHLVRIKMEDAR